MKILFVCLGNICRSPLARGIFRHRARQAGLNVESESAGFEAFHVGGPADPRSIGVASKNGIDISDHIARKFTTRDFDRFDRIYVMDEVNHFDVQSVARHEGDRMKVDYLLNVVHPGSNRQVPDPYYGGRNGFDHVFELLDEACSKLVEELRASAETGGGQKPMT